MEFENQGKNPCLEVDHSIDRHSNTVLSKYLLRWNIKCNSSEVHHLHSVHTRNDEEKTCADFWHLTLNQKNDFSMRG